MEVKTRLYSMLYMLYLLALACYNTQIQAYVHHQGHVGAPQQHRERLRKLRESCDEEPTHGIQDAEP